MPAAAPAATNSGLKVGKFGQKPREKANSLKAPIALPEAIKKKTERTLSTSLSEIRIAAGSPLSKDTMIKIRGAMTMKNNAPQTTRAANVSKNFPEAIAR